MNFPFSSRISSEGKNICGLIFTRVLSSWKRTDLIFWYCFSELLCPCFHRRFIWICHQSLISRHSCQGLSQHVLVQCLLTGYFQSINTASVFKKLHWMKGKQVLVLGSRLATALVSHGGQQWRDPSTLPYCLCQASHRCICSRMVLGVKALSEVTPGC